MRSMRVDCGPVRIGSWDELDAYMDGSAGSVGRIMAPLLGVPERYHADFGHLGQAFQLANFIRDVREDWAMDRIYMPAEDRERLGVAEEDFGRGRATPALRALVAQQVARARALFAAAEPAVAAAPASVRSGIRLACAAYGRILDRAEAAGGDVLGRRVGVRARDLRRAGGGAPAMTRRATLRGAERTPLEASADVLICGASFAGLAVARELAGRGRRRARRRPLRDRRARHLARARRRRRGCTRWASSGRSGRSSTCMAFHTPHGSARFRLPWSWSSFDYRELCAALWEQADARFEIAKVDGRDRRDGAHRSRRPDRAADRRRARLAARARRRARTSSRPRRGSRAASRSTRTTRAAPTSTSGSTARWSATATRGRCRRRASGAIGVGSYEPRDHVKEPTREMAAPAREPTPSATRATGSRTQLRPAAEDGVFFVGDSAGHCFPLSGEGIRTAFYFGIACGRELRAVLAGAQRREQALAAYGAFSAAHAPAFRAARCACSG